MNRSILALSLLIALSMGTSAIAVDTLTVNLLDAGSGAKTELRYTPAVGTTQTLTTKVVMRSKMTMGDNEMPTPPMPTVTTTFQLTVKAVDAAGDISYEYKLIKADVVAADILTPPQLVDSMKSIYEPVVGKSGVIVVDSRGCQKGAGSVPPQGLKPDQVKALTEMLRSATLPLPEGPVGAGAKWEVKTTSSQDTLRTESKSTVQLASVSGDTISLTADVKGKTNNPGGMGGAGGQNMAAINFIMSGKGKATVDLSKLAPIKHDMKLIMTGDMSQSAGGQSISMTMRTEVETHMASQ
jgi:hypothetical protein